MSAIEDYLRLRRECAAAQEKAERLVVQIRNIMRSLVHFWYRMRFEGMVQPAESLHDRHPQHITTAEDYPSYEELTKAIGEYHVAKQACDAAWATLSEADRQGLQAPPTPKQLDR